jgi:hypothetical protein
MSCVYIPFIKNYNYKYIAGGFYGAKTEYFIEMNNINYENVLTDLNNNFIACWHDESHLNNYYYKYISNSSKGFLLDKSYHVPEKLSKNFTNIKIIYLDKNKNHKIINYKNTVQGKCKTEINNDLINYYKNLNIE